LRYLAEICSTADASYVTIDRFGHRPNDLDQRRVLADLQTELFN
jgi:hypothetical protein